MVRCLVIPSLVRDTLALLTRHYLHQLTSHTPTQTETMLYIIIILLWKANEKVFFLFLPFWLKYRISSDSMSQETKTKSQNVYMHQEDRASNVRDNEAPLMDKKLEDCKNYFCLVSFVRKIFLFRQSCLRSQII